MTKGKFTKGFTLVELLVVIAIIAILAGAMFLIINPANLMMKARDSKRVSEITELNKAIALALADSKITSMSATAGNSITGTRVVTGTGWVGFTGTMIDYLGTLPADPTNVGTLQYQYAGVATPTNTWELNTTLESLDNTVKMTSDGGNSATKYEVGTDPGLDLIN